MSPAERRSAPDLAALTEAQRTILTYLARHADPNRVCARSSRQLVRETGLVRQTVQTAIDRLNELGYIRSRVRTTPHPSEHRLLVEVVPELSVRKRTAGGAR